MSDPVIAAGEVAIVVAATLASSVLLCVYSFRQRKHRAARHSPPVTPLPVEADEHPVHFQPLVAYVSAYKTRRLFIGI